jgi:hypothetical protein
MVLWSEEKVDENGNVWRVAPDGVTLVDTRGDRRPSHEFWHPGRGETKQGEAAPDGRLRPRGPVDAIEEEVSRA